MDELLMELTVEQARRVWVLEFIGPAQVVALVQANRLQMTVDSIMRLIQDGRIEPMTALEAVKELGDYPVDSSLLPPKVIKTWEGFGAAVPPLGPSDGYSTGTGIAGALAELRGEIPLISR
jgi:hypothetical protein